MEKLAEYIAFDLEFNTVAEKSHIIQVSAVKFKEVTKLTALTLMFTQMCHCSHLLMD